MSDHGDSRASRRLPLTVVLALAGTLVSAGARAAGLHIPIRLTPPLLVRVLLPPLLFEGAFHIELGAVRRHLRLVIALAGPGLLLGALLCGAVAWAGAPLGGAPRSLVFVASFAACVAATDPLSVLTVLRAVGAPSDLRAVLDAESLLNDGVAAVLAASVVLVTQGAGTGGAMMTAARVAWQGVGAVIVGLLTGGACARLRAAWRFTGSAIVVTTVLAWGTSELARALGASSILAVVIAGGVCQLLAPEEPAVRRAVSALWERLAFGGSTIVFILVGLSMPLVDLLHSAAAVLIAWAAMSVSRAGLVLAVRPLVRPLGRGASRVLGWGGLRGALSMVLAMGISVRGPLVTWVFGATLASLLLQGLTFDTLLRHLALARADR